MAKTAKIRVENYYSDGHHSVRQTKVAEPVNLTKSGLETWWDEVVVLETGDGHGVDPDLGYGYVATVLDSAHPALIGKSREWFGK